MEERVGDVRLTAKTQVIAMMAVIICTQKVVVKHTDFAFSLTGLDLWPFLFLAIQPSRFLLKGLRSCWSLFLGFASLQHGILCYWWENLHCVNGGLGS